MKKGIDDAGKRAGGRGRKMKVRDKKSRLR
jgi:hypothetical protein